MLKLLASTLQMDRHYITHNKWWYCPYTQHINWAEALEQFICQLYEADEHAEKSLLFEAVDAYVRESRKS